MANLRGGYEAPPSETSQESEERLQREEKARLIQRNLEKESVKKQILEVCKGLKLGNSSDVADKMATANLCELLQKLAGLSDIKLDSKISESPADFSCLLKLSKAHRFGYCNLSICCEIITQLLEAFGLLYSTQKKAQLLKELSELYITKASYDNTIKVTKQLAELASSLGNKKLEAEAHYILCKTFVLKGLVENAKLSLDKCVQCSEESGDELTIGYSKFAEGTVLVFEQNYEKALKIEEEFLEIAQRLKNKPAECEVIISMTRIYCKLFNIHEALNLHHKGYKMAKELGNQKLALKAKVNQALVYALTGKYKKTYETNKQMYENLGNNEDKDFEHTVLCNLSVDALILKKHEESLKLAQDSLLVAEELGAKDCIALSYGNIGLAQEQLQQFDEAISSFEKCLEHGKKIKDKRIINNSYCNLGRAYEGKGDRERARQFYLEALSMGEQPHLHWCDTEYFRFSPDYLFAKLAVEEKDYATAKKYFQQVVHRCEQYRKNVHDSPLKICFNDTQKKPFQYLQHVLLKEEAYAAALLVGEMGRGRDFYDRVIKEDQSKQLNTPEALLHLAKTNNQAVLFLSKLDVVEEMRIWFIASNGKITSFGCPLEEWNTLLARLGIAFHETATQMGSQTGQQTSGGAIDITSQAETARSCSIEYRGLDTEVSSDDESGDESECVHGECGEENENNKQNAAGSDKASSNIATTRDPNHSPNTAPKISDLIDKFSELIVRPLESQLKNMVSKDSHKPELLIIPQGQTFNIPYAALHLKSGEPLCSLMSPREAFSFHSYYYSTTLQQDAKSQLHQMKDILIVGNPTNDLQFVEKEAKMLAKKLRVKAFLNKSATRSEVLSRLSKAPIIHFACHGGTNGKCLILAPEQENNNATATESYLTAEDISNMSLQANMVVLSACNTARGKISCEGVLGLGRAFIIAGAKSVVTALWSVNDNSTEVLMSKFYDNLSSEPVVAALANAMYEMATEKLDVTQWGAFKVLGANVQVFSHFSEDDRTQT